MNKFIAKSLSFVLAASLIFGNTSITFAADTTDYSDESLVIEETIPAETEADMSDTEESEAAPASETEAAEITPMEYEIPEEFSSDNEDMDIEAAEEPIVEDPIVESILDDLVIDESITDEPITDEAIADEAGTDDLAADETVTDEPAADEGIMDVFVSDDIVSEETGENDPIGEEPENEEPVFVEQDLSETVSGSVVSVNGDMPEGATISVVASDRTTYVDQLADKFVPLTAFDINVVCMDDSNYQPRDYGKTLTVTFTGIDTSRHIVAYRIDEESGDITELPVSIDGDTVSITTDHFTIYELGYTDDDIVETYIVNSDITATLFNDGTFYIEGTGEMPGTVSLWEDKKAQIKKVVISEGIISISEKAFYNCTNLSSVVLPEGLTTIRQFAFAGCTSLTEVTIPSTVTYAAYVDTINNYSGAFANSGLVSISFSDGMNVIPDGVCADCTHLTTVSMPSSVTKIGKGAFKNCSSLASIVLHEGITHLYGYAFEGCASLTSIVLPSTLTYAGTASTASNGNSPFMNSGLQNAVFADGTNAIPSCIFFRCSTLTNVEMPNTVTQIGSYAFNRCTSLSQISMPDSVTSIGYMAYNECCAASSIYLSSNLNSISHYAFCGTTSLVYVNIPKSLTVVTNPSGTGTADVWSGSGIISASFEEGTTNIPANMFARASNLSSVILPDSVSSIGSYAFQATGLTSIDIPDNVTTISLGAFTNCSALSVVSGGASVISCSNKLFYVNSETPLTVRTSSSALRAYGFSSDNRIVTFENPPTYCLIKLPALLELTEDDDLFTANVVVSVDMKQGVAGKTNALKVTLNSGYISADSVNIPLDTFIYDEDGYKVFGTGSEMYFVSDFTDLSKLDVNDRKTYVDVGTETNVSLCYVYVRKENLIEGTDYTGSLNISYQFIKN